jgi:hypothetical protein
MAVLIENGPAGSPAAHDGPMGAAGATRGLVAGAAPTPEAMALVLLPAVRSRSSFTTEVRAAFQGLR